MRERERQVSSGGETECNPSPVKACERHGDERRMREQMAPATGYEGDADEGEGAREQEMARERERGAAAAAGDAAAAAVIGFLG